MKLKQRQMGMTFLGLLVVGSLLAFTGVILAQVVPTYIEYVAVDRAAKQAAAGNTVAEVRAIFDKAATIDNITTIAGKDLEISKQGDKVIVSYEYAREIHIAGPAYLVMKYAGSTE